MCVYPPSSILCTVSSVVWRIAAESTSAQPTPAQRRPPHTYLFASRSRMTPPDRTASQGTPLPAAAAAARSASSTRAATHRCSAAAGLLLGPTAVAVVLAVAPFAAVRAPSCPGGTRASARARATWSARARSWCTAVLAAAVATGLAPRALAASGGTAREPGAGPVVTALLLVHSDDGSMY